MKRYKHNLSHHTPHTFNLGQIYPVGCHEVLPGDMMQHRTSALVRFIPQLAPVMHKVDVRIMRFYCPNRILWSGWEDFITGGPDGNDASVPPTVSTGATPATTAPLLLAFGIPAVANTDVSALPVRAYNKVVNEYFRDQDLISVYDQDDLTIKQAAWSKDRYTSARPWQQKGDSVSIPFGSGSAPVTGIGVRGAPFGNQAVPFNDVKETDASGNTTYNDYENFQDGLVYLEEDPNSSGYPNVRANLSGVDAIDVHALREGLALQRYKEARARYGSRYTEYLRYCGVIPSDARLQRPEYLGGGRQTVSFSEVLATGWAKFGGNGTTPPNIGAMGGHGISALKSKRSIKFFEEHGFVITLMVVRPKPMYNDLTQKMWLRTEKEDYYQKELELVGQQEIYKRELYTTGTATDDEVFAYGDRYREYTELPSYTTGEMKAGEINDHWTFTRALGGSPTLNQSFIECVPTDRVFSTSNVDQMQVLVNHSIQARRYVMGRAQPRIV